MLIFLIFSKFISALLTVSVGVGMLLLIRKKRLQNVKEDAPAGFWIRALCLGTDFAIVDLLSVFFAYHGSFRSLGFIYLLLMFSYFFLFWLFFASTPAMRLAKLKIISQEKKPLELWQIVVRLCAFTLLIIGWITVFFDKKEKRIFHDFASKTHIVYSEKITIDSSKMKNAYFILLGLVPILLVGLIAYGRGEKLTSYVINEQISFFDFNKDGLTDALTIDADKDGKAEVYKYDLNNDNVIDYTAMDSDKDGVAESIDINNDSRIDGYDFDNDRKLDITVLNGQLFLWMWRVIFSIWIVSFGAVVGFLMLKEKTDKKEYR